MTAPTHERKPNPAANLPEPTWEIAYLFPTQGNWTVDEYFALDTHWYVEFNDGVLEVLHTADEPQPPAELVAAHPEVTWEVAYLFPAQGQWSVGDYMALRPNRHIEFSDGYLEVLPLPKQSHQFILEFIYLALRAFVIAQNLGRLAFAPLRVRLAENHYREPDLVFMLAKHSARRHEDFWDGADLVLEIISDDNRSRERDLREKHEEYALAGIPEYWVVDPVHEIITVLFLQDEAYQPHGEFKRGEQATSRLLDGFSVDVAAVFDAGKA